MAIKFENEKKKREKFILQELEYVENIENVERDIYLFQDLEDGEKNDK